MVEEVVIHIDPPMGVAIEAIRRASELKLVILKVHFSPPSSKPPFAQPSQKSKEAQEHTVVPPVTK